MSLSRREAIIKAVGAVVAGPAACEAAYVNAERTKLLIAWLSSPQWQKVFAMNPLPDLPDYPFGMKEVLEAWQKKEIQNDPNQT